jgi:hypothetical protein
MDMLAPRRFGRSEGMTASFLFLWMEAALALLSIPKAVETAAVLR